MKTLIIGAGEIGRSLAKVLSVGHEVFIRDKETAPKPFMQNSVTSKPDNWDVLNICYPPSKEFVKITKEYIKLYRPKVTIIHSTVAPGTTEKCGEMVVHSPVHGKHPDISSGLLTYAKYLGGNNAFAVDLAKNFLQKVSIPVKVVANSKSSELSKILCTTYYGWNIVFMKEVVEICKKYKVPFGEVYVAWNLFYNEGNIKMGVPQFNRPILSPIPGKIGGHCVVENCHLLDSEITDFIIKQNGKY